VRTKQTFVCLLVVAVSATAAPSEDIINHLERTIAWYRHLQTVEQASGDVLERQRVQQSSLKALQLAFDFARAEAALLAPEAQQSAQSAGNFQQAAAHAADRVNELQSRISELGTAIAKAPASKRGEMEAQRRTLGAELQLAKDIQITVQTLATFSGTAGASGGLAGQIDLLERTVPEAHHDKRAASPEPAPTASSGPTNTASPPQAFDPSSRGLVGLISDVFSIRGKRGQFIDLEKETEALSAEIDKLRAPLVSELRTSVRRADEIANSAPAQGGEQELEALSARFKQTSTAIVPLSEQGIATGTVRSYLQASIGDLDANFSKAARYLLLRAIMLALAIFVILAVSEVWRRATFRYVSDIRRRRQFLMLRRVIVTAAVVFTIMLAFVSEFGSLATYAGFVTAGIAVALQSPILSVVAYFFLIGRYGLRVGDRVTISGVTGQVMDIGLVRIYLMELGPDMHSTGRIVVFSNSVIFQPTAALYKQMPGVDYIWHTVSLTLSPESDFDVAEKKLSAAVDSIYQQYREKFERQHRNLEKSIDVDVAAPRPETRLRFTDAGLVFTARYPAELKQASATDDLVMKALYDAIASEPKLTLAPAGGPKIQLAA
jgi:small-conductance mechanosensitive channel